MAKFLLSCLGCAQDFPGELVNCPRCCPVNSPHSARPKEAHVHAALNAAIDAMGVATLEDTPLVVQLLEELPQVEGHPKRFRQVEEDNTDEHRKVFNQRSSLEEAFLRGAAGAPRLHKGASHDPKEAHQVLGDNEAIGYRIKAAVEAAALRAKDERTKLVAAIVKELTANPASAIDLAKRHPLDVLSEALKAFSAPELPGPSSDFAVPAGAGERINKS